MRNHLGMADWSLRGALYGSKGGGGGTQTVTQKTELPGWVNEASKGNYDRSVRVADTLQGPYTGQRVAALNSGQLSAIQGLQNNVGSTNPAFQSAQTTAQGLQSYTPSQVTAGNLAQTDLSGYMNPYTNSVVNSGLNSLDLMRQNSINQNADNAYKARAFGGNRQAITDAVTNAGVSRQAADFAANAMNANFMQAQNAATTDLNRQYQAAVANQQAGLQGGGLQLSAANAGGQLAGQGQQAFLQGNAAALAGAGQLQDQNQRELTAAQQLYEEQGMYPIKQLQILQGSLSQSPYGQTQTTTGPGPQSNGTMQGIGAAAAGVGMLGSLFGPAGTFAGAIPGIMGALGGSSDEREKTDKKKLGVDPDSGLEMWAYRYKGDPKSYPKVVGPMAQDIEKKYPGSTKEVGGSKVVTNLGFGGMQRFFPNG